MQTKIQKWGNSQGFRIPKALLMEADLEVNDAVNIQVKNGALIITPVRRIRNKYDLKKLVAQIPEDYTPEETDWGGPVGEEVW